MKKVFVFVGHPSKSSLCKSIGEAYLRGAKNSGYKTKIMYLSEMEFDSNLKEGYKLEQVLEEDLVLFQKNLLWADHIVFVTPIWWGSIPAKFKGAIDRAILPGFAFKYEKKSLLPKQFFRGKSGTIIFTKGGPWLFYFGALVSSSMVLRRFVLNFIGVSPVRVKSFYSVRKLSPERAKRILDKVFRIGKKGR